MIGNAVKDMRIAVGDEADLIFSTAKTEDGVTVASKGGKARAAKLKQERRSEIARNAAGAKWAKLPVRAEEEDS